MKIMRDLNSFGRGSSLVHLFVVELVSMMVGNLLPLPISAPVVSPDEVSDSQKRNQSDFHKLVHHLGSAETQEMDVLMLLKQLFFFVDESEVTDVTDPMPLVVSQGIVDVRIEEVYQVVSS